VPLHETTAAALARYLEHRHAVGGADDHIFISTHGHALTYAMVNGTFHFLLRFVTLRAPLGQGAPRILTLWKAVADSVRAWLAVRGDAPVPELFLNARGKEMTRAG